MTDRMRRIDRMMGFTLLPCFVCLLGFFFTSAQQTPIREEIFDSTSLKSPKWISHPPNAWHTLSMQLGSSQSVLQGCESNHQKSPKILWTNWISKKDAQEVLLDLQFAQDDQISMKILILESDQPVESPYMGRAAHNITAPRPFPSPPSSTVEKEYLYDALGLHLGKISQKGFHLGFYYSGSCILITSVRVFYLKCPEFTGNQSSFGEVAAGSGLSSGQCVEAAEEISTPKMECLSNGHWGVLQGLCVCGAGYQAKENLCEVCRMGSYKPKNDSGECRLCPSNSRTNSEGASECECNDGYARLQDDPPQLGCTRSPSAPLNLTLHNLNNTALTVNWAPPADLGGRMEVMYSVECRQKTGIPNTSWIACDETIFIIPQATGLTETVARITGLHPHVDYQISVRARNHITAKLGSSGAETSISVWKTPVIIPYAPVTEDPFQLRVNHKVPIIAGVLCGTLLLLSLIPILLCFVRRKYSKLGGEPDVELIPLQQDNVRTYRPRGNPEVSLPHQTSSTEVLHGISDRLLHGIRDVLVDRSKVTLGKELGKGEFGAVYEGVFSPQEGESIKVAVKTMRVGIYSEDDLQSFLKEAEIMQHFDHDNVVKLLGVALEREQDSSIPFPLVILPYLKHGDLRRFLIATRYGDVPMFVPDQSLLRFMVDIATGMEYLSSKGFLHRDLAARNCMLGDDLCVRVADFGLSKQIFSSDYYRQRVAVRMPVKWMAIESLSESIYTSKSDVWSFGVTMWEIMSRGKSPYPGIPNHELLELLESGHRLKQGDWDSKLYDVMLNCWDKDPSQRPCFTELCQRLKALLSELPPLEATKEAYYINQGLEAANASQSGAASPDTEGASRNIYLPAPVARAVSPKQHEETKDELEDGYLVCNKTGL